VLHDLIKEQQDITDECIHKKENSLEKKSLDKILSAYFGKKINEKVLKRLKKEFLDLKINMDSKNSYEVLIKMQEKLAQVYKELDEEEKESSAK